MGWARPMPRVRACLGQVGDVRAGAAGRAAGLRAGGGDSVRNVVGRVIRDRRGDHPAAGWVGATGRTTAGTDAGSVMRPVAALATGTAGMPGSAGLLLGAAHGHDEGERSDHEHGDEDDDQHLGEGGAMGRGAAGRRLANVGRVTGTPDVC